ncbi:MAG: PIG-L deacetylase family protein [Gammaproteobacteria bacterium]
MTDLMKELPFKEVLVIAPHTDDGELGAGGTIARLIEEGARVTYAAFSTAQQSVPKGLPPDILVTEVREATKRLGITPDRLKIYDYEVRKLNYARQQILEDLVVLRAECKYDLVLAPSRHDIHQDHATVADEAVRCFKQTTLLGYELIWNNLSFDTQAFIQLGDAHIDAKSQALDAYSSQRRRDYMQPGFTRSMAHIRGVQIGVKYAECFEVIRVVF